MLIFCAAVGFVSATIATLAAVSSIQGSRLRQSILRARAEAALDFSDRIKLIDDLYTMSLDEEALSIDGILVEPDALRDPEWAAFIVGLTPGGAAENLVLERIRRAGLTAHQKISEMAARRHRREDPIARQVVAKHCPAGPA